MDSYREIEHLIYRYAELIDSGDLNGMANLFSHAEFVDPDGKLMAKGTEEFLDLQRRAVNISPKNRGNPQTKHITANVIIEVDETWLMQQSTRQPPDLILRYYKRPMDLLYNRS
jgi:hypothetical protein